MSTNVYHDHLDVCKVCHDSPMNGCSVGNRLLREQAVGRQRPDVLDPDVVNRRWLPLNTGIKLSDEMKAIPGMHPETASIVGLMPSMVRVAALSVAVPYCNPSRGIKAMEHEASYCLPAILRTPLGSAWAFTRRLSTGSAGMSGKDHWAITVGEFKVRIQLNLAGVYRLVHDELWVRQHEPIQILSIEDCKNRKVEPDTVAGRHVVQFLTGFPGKCMELRSVSLDYRELPLM
jgi:hypothetical protein